MARFHVFYDPVHRGIVSTGARLAQRLGAPASRRALPFPASNGRTPWTVVWVVVACGVVAAFHLGKVAIATHQLQTEMKLSLSMLGSVGATFAVLGALGGAVAGSIVARAGDRRMLIVGLSALVVGTMIAIPASGVGLLRASRLIEGFGFLLITVAGPTLLGRIVCEKDQRTALALWSCFMPAGMALAMLLGPWFSDWRTMWAGTGLVTAGLAALVAGLVSCGPPAAHASRSSGWRVSVCRGPSLMMGATFLLYSLMFFALFNFFPVLLQERLRMDAQTVGLFAALACAANILGNLSAGYLLKKSSQMVLGMTAAITMGICGLGIFLPTLDPELALILSVVFSAVGGLIPASLLLSVPQFTNTRAQAALAVGILMQGSNLGQALGPVLVGSAVDLAGWPAAAALVAAAALGMLWTVWYTSTIAAKPSPCPH